MQLRITEAAAAMTDRMVSAYIELKRGELLDHYGTQRHDLPRLQRDQIVAKITSASVESIRTDQPCVGKHWFLMSAPETCPYCEWKLTLR